MNTTSPITILRSESLVSVRVRHTAKEWDVIRSQFYTSILADTPLSSLAQNLEGLDWPLKGPGEVPSAYLDMSFNTLREHLALRGQPPVVADQLIDILKETLAFDNPFGEMVTEVGKEAVEENPISKNLVKLKIPADFPVALTALSSETQFFCELEKIRTVGELALASQRMAGTVVVGGDFRSLLNALSNIDECTLAIYLPYRVGSTGLHYIEGLAQAVTKQPASIQAALAHRAQQPLPDAAMKLARSVTRSQMEKVCDELQLHAAALRGFCQQDYQDVAEKIASGVNARRLTTVLRDPVLEAVVADLLAPSVKPAGLIARLISWWRK